MVAPTYLSQLGLSPQYTPSAVNQSGQPHQNPLFLEQGAGFTYPAFGAFAAGPGNTGAGSGSGDGDGGGDTGGGGGGRQEPGQNALSGFDPSPSIGSMGGTTQGEAQVADVPGFGLADAIANVASFALSPVGFGIAAMTSDNQSTTPSIAGNIASKMGLEVPTLDKALNFVGLGSGSGTSGVTGDISADPSQSTSPDAGIGNPQGDDAAAGGQGPSGGVTGDISADPSQSTSPDAGIGGGPGVGDPGVGAASTGVGASPYRSGGHVKSYMGGGRVEGGQMPGGQPMPPNAIDQGPIPADGDMRLEAIPVAGHEGEFIMSPEMVQQIGSAVAPSVPSPIAQAIGLALLEAFRNKATGGAPPGSEMPPTPMPQPGNQSALPPVGAQGQRLMA